MNISRNGGFPLCAESLEILANNAAMTEELLKAIPLNSTTAVLFQDRNYVCFGLEKNEVFFVVKRVAKIQ